MNKNNLNVRFDSATVTLDQTKQTDKITLHVGVQNVPVNVDVVDTNGVTHRSTLDYNPVDHSFTNNNLTGDLAPGFTLTATSDANGHITATPAGNFLIANGSVQLGTDGTVPGVLQFVQYQLVTKTAQFYGTVNGESGTTPTQHATLGQFIHVYSPDIQIPYNINDGHSVTTGHFSTTAEHLVDKNGVDTIKDGTGEIFLNLDKIENGVATVFEGAKDIPGSFAANMKNFIHSLDLHNKLDTTDGENFGVNGEHLTETGDLFQMDLNGHILTTESTNKENALTNLGNTLHFTYSGDTIAISENPFHGMHVSYPGHTGSVDVIKNGEGLIVSESIDENGAQSFSLNHVASTNELNTAHSLTTSQEITDAVHSYLVDTTHATGELATYINQLTVTFDSTTGEINIGDSSQGAFGYTLGQQQTQFNPQGYSLEIKETVQKNFQIPLSITINPQNPDPQNPQPIINFGQLNFDKTTDQWTPDATNTPGQEHGIEIPSVPGHPGVKLTFDPTTKVFTMKTDGTFTPTSINGNSWTQVPGQPNVWTIDPNNLGIDLVNPPMSPIVIPMEANTNTQTVNFEINVNTNTAKISGLGTNYGKTSVTHDLFTGINTPLTFGTFTSVTDKAGHEVVTGFDKHLSNGVGELPDQTGEQAFTVTSIPGFATEYTKSVDPSTKVVTYVANLSSHFDDNTGHRGGDHGLDGHKHKNNGENLSPVTVELTGDSFGTITGHITQDPITGEYNLIDTQTGAPISLSKGNIHTVVTKDARGNFVVTLGAGSTANNYNFDSGSIISGAFGGGSTHGTTNLKVSGDSMTINF